MVRARVFAVGIGLAMLAAACGGAAATSSGSGQTTVSMRQVAGVGSIYTDAQGKSLYTPAQEAAGKILCTGSCTTVWIPLSPPASGT